MINAVLSEQSIRNIITNQNALYRLIGEQLSSHEHTVHRYADVPYREAAVLIPIFFKNNSAHLLFTKRTDKVEHHKGQISFPGGVRDAEDKDLLHTALRETEEEMGIQADDITILGKTDTFLTNTNYLVTPYVGFFTYPYTYQINYDEISKVIEVPLAHLLVPEIFETRIMKRGGFTWRVHFYQYHEESIWGVTGFLLSNFLHIVFDLER
jgi:8-oxo-dGTP pyrophosphatase MutT (NUDIX family)